MRMIHAQVERVETGPVRFGEDWPGVFIRGDDARHLQCMLHALLNDPLIAPLAETRPAVVCALSELHDLIDKAIVR